MTPIYLKILCWLLLTLVLGLCALLRISLRLQFVYPFKQPPRLPFSADDWPFFLRMAKFLRNKLQLKQLHGQILLIGRPDICALAGGALTAALHGLAAAANCRDADLQLHLAADETEIVNCQSGEIMVKISLPLWAIITAALRLAAYYIRCRRRLKPTGNQKGGL